MNNIQIGFDIATSVSIIAAAIGFLVSQVTQARQARTLAVKQKRIEQMTRFIADFLIIVKDGYKIVDRLNKLKMGKDIDFSSDEFVDFCNSVRRTINWQTKFFFGVWATDEERKILDAIDDIVRIWHGELITAYKTSDGSKMPQMHTLIDDIEAKVKCFSQLLRLEVEKFNN